MKLTIGLILANGFPVPASFVKSYSLLQQYLLTGIGNATLPPGKRIESANVLFSEDFPIDWARNRICQLFLDENNSDYLLFLDTDMTHQPDLPHQLIRHGKDVVLGRYVTRRPPFFTVAMRKVGPTSTDFQAIEKLMPYEDIKGLLPIDAGGAGALLISRGALVKMREHLGCDDWFRYQDEGAKLRCRSEDMWFYDQARACGIQPYLDADTRCGHMTTVEVDTRNHLPYREQFDRIQDEKVSA